MTEAEAAHPIRCGDCGADLSNWPSAAAGHVCEAEAAQGVSRILSVIRLLYQPTSDWPLDKRLWKAAHGLVNRAAWRWARPPGPTWGSAGRIDHSHPLWRLNDWLGPHWTLWWVNRDRRAR